MQCREFSIMAAISGKENTEQILKHSKVVNVSVLSTGKHSTNQNEIAFKK